MTVQRLLSPVKLTDVVIEDPFWSLRLAHVRQETLLAQYQHLEKTGRLAAFGLQWKPGEPNKPHIFWDSDVAKWVEAASYALCTHVDTGMLDALNGVAELIASAAGPDGYLNTHFTVVEPDKRWTDLRDAHELYCAGHIFEAAVAHHQATGNDALLSAARRYADYIGSVFGPGAGQKSGYCGHPEIELALVKLFHATGERRYLDLAAYFVNQRGQQPNYFVQEQGRGEDRAKWPYGGPDYYQAHKPVREQSEAVGHAVRAMYLYSGMADVAAQTGDESLLEACRRLWADLTEGKLYITGGVGARHQGESLGESYELPNETAYAETCAAVGLVFFAHRMLQIEADGRYADVMERALYNGVLAGMSQDGRRFFYVNPLASSGKHHRQGWFDCACCPPNIARLLTSLGQYAYSTAADGLFVHLYISGDVTWRQGGSEGVLAVQTSYPWEGKVTLTVKTAPALPWSLHLRVPGWCRRYQVRVNGKVIAIKPLCGYVNFTRPWQAGDTVELVLEMPAERMAASPAVADDVARVAIVRGPLVYCLEECDHQRDVRSLRLSDDAVLGVKFDKKLLGGSSVVTGSALAPRLEGWHGQLYRSLGAVREKSIRFTAVPYFLWDNRQAGSMAVWLPRA